MKITSNEMGKGPFSFVNWMGRLISKSLEHKFRREKNYSYEFHGKFMLLILLLMSGHSDWQLICFAPGKVARRSSLCLFSRCDRRSCDWVAEHNVDCRCSNNSSTRQIINTRQKSRNKHWKTFSFLPFIIRGHRYNLQNGALTCQKTKVINAMNGIDKDQVKHSGQSFVSSNQLKNLVALKYKGFVLFAMKT